MRRHSPHRDRNNFPTHAPISPDPGHFCCASSVTGFAGFLEVDLAHLHRTLRVERTNEDIGSAGTPGRRTPRRCRSAVDTASARPSAALLEPPTRALAPSGRTEGLAASCQPPPPTAAFGVGTLSSPPVPGGIYQPLYLSSLRPARGASPAGRAGPEAVRVNPPRYRGEGDRPKDGGGAGTEPE